MGGFSFPNAANTFTTTMNIPVPTANTVVTMPTTGTVVSSTEPMSGMVIQVANFTTGALATSTVLIPTDDTIPQNTEGVQVLSLIFVPKRATSKLKIEVTTVMSHSVIAWMVSALFRDAVADSLGASNVHQGTAGASVAPTFTVYVNANSIASTTFNVRIGAAAAGTTTFNGAGGGRYLGGAMASSITITEIAQ